MGKLRLVDDAHKQKLSELEAKIDAAKTPEVRKRHGDDHYSQAHLAWRMVIELVVGLGIGFAIGYGLDSLFGTMPIFLVVFILLGFAAGVKTMMRTANELQDQKLAADAAEKQNDEQEGL